MEISTSASPAGRREAAAGRVHRAARVAAVLALWLAVIPQANAAVGDLDVRFGTNGEVVVEGNTGPAVVELPDGRWLVVGSPNPDSAVSRGTVAINRFKATGEPDGSFGSAGRVVVTLAPFDVWIRAAALQPDGKLVLAGLASTASGDGVRFVARLTANGVVDAGFGIDGVAVGGFGGWGGYHGVVVLPNGDILAAIGEWDGHRRIDRFSSIGAPTTGTQLDSLPAFMAVQAEGRVVVIGRRQGSNVAWRQLPDGRLDTSFGTGGYATLSPAFISHLALDPTGQRIAVCSNLGVQQFTADGRADLAFGPNDGLASFNSGGRTRASRCEGLLVNADGSVVVGASHVQGTEAVLYHGYVIGLRPDGSPDLRFDGRGYVEVRTGSAPGSRWAGLQLRRTTDQNALFVWSKQIEGLSQTIVNRIDLGQGAAAGAVGVPLAGVRVMEGNGSYLLKVVRSGNPQGAASVRIETRPGSASSADFVATAQELTWSDGASDSKFVELRVTDDGEFEGEESFEITLVDSRGVALATDTVTVTIVDDDALRALRIVDTEIVVKSGAKDRPIMRVSRDDLGAGPVTAYYYLSNGFDACCIGRVSWAPGERGTKEVLLPEPAGYLSGGYGVELLDENWKSLLQSASVRVTASAAPTPPPAPTPPSQGGGGNGNGGGGAATLVDLVLFGVGLWAATGLRRRKAAMRRAAALRAM